jgi:hypothetical protein
MRFPKAAAAAGLCLFAACAGSDAANDNAAIAADSQAAAAGDAAAVGAESCVVGTYSMVEGGFTKTFTFNADRSGQEVQAESDVRPFTWELKDSETLHIVYPSQGDVVGSEWDLGFNCAERAVTWGGARYSR